MAEALIASTDTRVLPLELDLLGDRDKLDLDPADLIRMTMARIYELPELPA